MNLLAPNLQAKIKERPTKTLIRSDSLENQIHHVRLLKLADTPNIGVVIPDNFDGRKVWEGLLIPPKNQGSCSSCWAFATVSCLSDRFNIQSMGLMYVDLGATPVILCDFKGKELDIQHPEKNIEGRLENQLKGIKNGACFGNTLYDSWRYLYVVGTNTEKCVPYDQNYGLFKEFKGLGSFSDNVTTIPLCSQVTGVLGDMCANFYLNTHTSEETGTPARFYRTLHFYAVAGVARDGGNEKNIRQNIYNWGPVTSGMIIYSDFYTFDAKNSIYEWDGESPQVGGHAIEIVGWGVSGEKDYWIIKNSWGIEWGDGGYFKMVRGNNNCEMEENIITGIPDYFYPLDFNPPTLFTFKESKKAQEDRKKINVDLTVLAGGIDPETGYSRRIKATMSWIDFSKPVKLSQLPDYTKWIAGIDASLQNRKRKTWENKNTTLKKQSGWLVFLLLLFFILLLLLLLLLLLVLNLY